MIIHIDMYNLILENLVNEALKEDLSTGDITTDTIIPPFTEGKAIIKAKDDGILSGINVARMVFKKVDSSLDVNLLITEGSALYNGDIIANVEGHISSILNAERTTLNFLQHLSGIATVTSMYVKAVEGLPVKISDTRKTTPGLRILEKQAVLSGGGINHRMNLGESILIKNNHLTVCQQLGLSIKEIINIAKQVTRFTVKTIEIEVNTAKQAAEAAESGATIIMLDNMSISEMSESVIIINKRCIVEASGGITLENVRQIADTGIDIISIGAITHSAKALDISLQIL